MSLARESKRGLGRRKLAAGTHTHLSDCLSHLNGADVSTPTATVRATAATAATVATVATVVTAPKEDSVYQPPSLCLIDIASQEKMY